MCGLIRILSNEASREARLHLDISETGKWRAYPYATLGSYFLRSVRPVTEIHSHHFINLSYVAPAEPHTEIPVPLRAFKGSIFAESTKAYALLVG
jgi:hypothetical protein